MEKGNQPAAGAAARATVQGREAEADELIECRLNVVCAIRHVVETVAAASQESGDPGTGSRGAEKFDPRLTDFEHDSLDAVGLHDLAVARRPCQEALICLHRRVDVTDGDAHVVDPGQHPAEYGTVTLHGAHGAVARRRRGTPGSMLRSGDPMPRHRLAVAAVAASLLVAYAVLWLSVSDAQIGTSDFTATYVGGALLRQGQRAAIYDPSLQAHMYAALVPSSRGGSLGFVYPPPAAVLVLPLTLLPLHAAYRVYQVLQLAMLALGVILAARTAPWPRVLARGFVPWLAALVALAGVGTFALGLLGQWDGVGALGLGGAYALWRRDARFAGGMVLAASAAVAKPHLALGLAALLVGWRERRVLAGAATGVAAMIVVSLVAVGPSGLSAFLASTQTDAGRWPLASMLGFTGLFGSWLGNGAAPQLLAATGSVLALGACVWLGQRLRRDRTSLEPCLAAAMLLSLLASPHLLTHDLTMLEPVLVGVLAWAGVHDRSSAWPGAWSRAVLAGWGVLGLAALFDLGSEAPAPPGRLVPWALLALAGVLIGVVRGQGAAALRRSRGVRLSFRN